MQAKIYRNGTKTLAERITAALSHYHVHNGGELPAAVIVNPRDLAEAGAIVKVLLGSVTLAVIGNGGVSVREVWLQEPEKK